jgi:hypothetical protein
MARETKDILAQICDKYCELNIQVSFVNFFYLKKKLNENI